MLQKCLDAINVQTIKASPAATTILKVLCPSINSRNTIYIRFVGYFVHVKEMFK